MFICKISGSQYAAVVALVSRLSETKNNWFTPNPHHVKSERSGKRPPPLREKITLQTGNYFFTESLATKAMTVEMSLIQ